MGKKHEDIKPREGFHFVAIDKKANFETLDYLNKRGILTTHIRKYYGVDVPSLYYRKKYRLENGKEWWEQWFTIKEVENKETKIWEKKNIIYQEMNIYSIILFFI